MKTNLDCRLARPMLWVGLGSIALSLVMVLVSVLASLEMPNERRPWAIALMGGFWLLPLLGGLHLALAYRRHRLVVTDHEVTSTGVCRTMRLSLDRVEEARWQPSGALQLRSREGRLRLDLTSYPLEQCRQLIRFFRDRLPAEKQQGWEKFWQFRWRLFDEPDPARLPEQEARAAALRRRLHRWLVLGALAIAGVSFYVWHVTGRPAGFAGLLLIAYLWFLVRRLRGGRGRIAEQLDAQQGRGLYFLGAGMLVLTATTGLSLLLAAGNWSGGRPVFWAGSILAIGLMLIAVVLLCREQSRVQREAARMADEENLLAGPRQP